MSIRKKLLMSALLVLSALSMYASQIVSYEYNMRGRVSKQRVNDIDIVFSYDKLGRLKTKTLGSVQNPISKLEYFYGANGQIIAREVNGVKQNYKYDELGQLLSVASNGAILEQYKYDPAGNILSKTINGETTTYKYDASNQLVSSNENGKITTFEYDAAGRMIQEGTTSYSYNFNNKVVKAGDNTYSYYASGQIASASLTNGEKEDFTWDGLALLRRDNTNYLNEPYATGGNPVLAGKKVLFNDMLGTTQGSISKNGKYQATNRTAFGAGSKEGFFTGKPHVEGLGSVFLYRNYRPNQAKWTASDPIGYPDGSNNFAYVNNKVINNIDWLGGESYTITGVTSVYSMGSRSDSSSIHHDLDENITTISLFVTFYIKIDSRSWGAQTVTTNLGNTFDISAGSSGSGYGEPPGTLLYSGIWDLLSQEEAEAIVASWKLSATSTINAHLSSENAKGAVGTKTVIE